MRRYNLLKRLGFGATIHTLREYIDVKLALLKYRLGIYMYRFIGGLLVLCIVCLFWIIAWGLVNVSCAVYLNDLLQSTFVGYLIVAGMNFLIGVCFLVFLKSRHFSKFIDKFAQGLPSQKDEL